LSLRLIEFAGLTVAFAAGAALTPGTISIDAGRTLVIFLGLVAASILPTITLLINSMTSSERSIQSIELLETELQRAMDALFLLFGSIIIGVGALITLTIEPASILNQIPYVSSQVLPRLGQAFVVVSAALVLWKIGQIPGILRRTLQLRYEGALEEAKRKIENNQLETKSLRQNFATNSEFGKVVSLQDLHNHDIR